MERTQVTIILQVLNYALRFGVPAVMEIIQAWDKDEVTIEDIEALGEKMEARDTDNLRS